LYGKAWIDIKSPRFSYLHPIQYLVVMEFIAKPVLSPKLELLKAIKSCDIFNPSFQGIAGDI